jgi:hypothetical protein
LLPGAPHLPSVGVAAVAAATTRIGIGTSVSPLPRRRPWELAALVREAGRDLAGYDIKVSGNPHRLVEFAAAGATWWGQWIPPGHPDDTRKSMATGPPSLR